MNRKIIVTSCAGCQHEYSRHCKHPESKNMYLSEWFYNSTLVPDNCPLPKDDYERCICAAWKAKNNKVYIGHRHIHCLDAMEDTGTEPLTKGDMGQGFITSTGRFVNREEGYQLHKSNCIDSVAKGGYRGQRLFSEDLY